MKEVSRKLFSSEQASDGRGELRPRSSPLSVAALDPPVQNLSRALHEDPPALPLEAHGGMWSHEG